MSDNGKIIRVPTTKYKLCSTINFSWFLENAEKFDNGTRSQPVPATFKALVNGKEAFEELHNRIENAKSSIDIAIWGFQPSMHFKRDGHSPCIGDLLIQKALEGVKVRILVWSMPLNLQTVMEANLGYRPDAVKKSVQGVTKEQKDYDRWWYDAIEGALDEELVNFKSSNHDWMIDEIEKHKTLMEFTKSPQRTNLIYKNRKVAKQENNYKDKTLPEEAQRRQKHNFKDTTLPDGSYNVALKYAPSHHQKTVLIDYDKPDVAVGFVLEHNMVDNYWDTGEHSLKTTAPNQGKNSKTPLQDVSSIVTGQVLWDINHNFCQSWDRKNNTQWDSDAVETNLTAQRNGLTREHYPPNPSLVEGSKLLMAQILRTYDQPDVEDIMKVYLKNIKQTTSYLYTENQYFRFPPLVREFIAHWENLKSGGRAEGPIHWFTVTNSSDEGIGKGTYTTNEMFKLLGKQEVMPGVARAIKRQELELELGKRKVNQAILYNKARQMPTPEGKAAAQAEYQANEQEIQRLEKELADFKAKQREAEKKQAEQKAKHKENAQTIENQELSQEESNLTKELGYEISDTPGIKAHICTLMPKDEHGKYVHSYKDSKGNETLTEVYVHSKVTIMDDVFTVISSANLNTRSMQVDTELGIIMECGEVAEGLRKRLWDLHTNKNGAANPDNLHDYAVAKEAFRKWGELIERNKRSQKDGTSPECALREFYRADPTVSRSD
ncbi:phospholipase D-like domain-containing protein [Rodentibacter caecimuris]|uniref:phospholipase D-like domain-containing protein n=1 Tax=Rodentibacter caecimuris TaxID=1796644 RepID=UPI0013A09A39|nr:phospholipase D-like domain-containing protein [Rodentibacter heylii]QIA77653.1 phospholipase [Rodentibacter heylii]